MEHLTYHSKFCGLDRNVNVLLPANYDKSKKYPVVYFLHGFFGDEFTIPKDEGMQAKEIAAKACADGKEMIVVFPYIFATKDVNLKPDFNEASVNAYDSFIFDLTESLMPFIKANFSILEGRENTAICGFSMGGRESIYIGLKHPELFGYVGAFAPAPGLVPGKDKNMPHPGQLQENELTFEGKEKPFYFQICCGSVDDVVVKFPESYHNIFEANKVEHVWFEQPGAGHNGAIVAPGFTRFVENIF